MGLQQAAQEKVAGINITIVGWADLSPILPLWKMVRHYSGTGVSRSYARTILVGCSVCGMPKNCINHCKCTGIPVTQTCGMKLSHHLSRLTLGSLTTYILYILESNPHSVFGDFLNGKKLVRGSNPHLSFYRPLPTGRLIEYRIYSRILRTLIFKG
jgi:hypothetical protein